VTGVDAERKTATAKFVLFITIEVPDYLLPDEKNKDKDMEAARKSLR
jgi:hypothetical protein